jgi:hypothetical protein
MQLYLLEFTYAVEDRETVEAWLPEADLSGVLISNQQYDDEVFAVLASERAMRENHQKLALYPAISSCQIKQSVLYRIITTATPEAVFHSFPLAEGDEWYWGVGKMCYLSTLSQKLKQAQITWLATCPEIASWEYLFDLMETPASY